MLILNDKLFENELNNKTNEKRLGFMENMRFLQQQMYRKC